MSRLQKDTSQKTVIEIQSPNTIAEKIRNTCVGLFIARDDWASSKNGDPSFGLPDTQLSAILRLAPYMYFKGIGQLLLPKPLKAMAQDPNEFLNVHADTGVHIFHYSLAPKTLGKNGVTLPSHITQPACIYASFGVEALIVGNVPDTQSVVNQFMAQDAQAAATYGLLMQKPSVTTLFEKFPGKPVIVDTVANVV